MSATARVTVIVDNAPPPPLLAEHGLALLVEYRGARVLVDTGAGRALLPNARTLGIDLGGLDLVLTHGHRDHSGGLAPELRPRRIWHAPGVDAERVSRHPDGRVHPLGMPPAARACLREFPAVAVTRMTEIAPGMFLTGPVPRRSGEDTGGDFYLDEICTRPDMITDEQALLLDNGLLITGCGHAGIVNTLDRCRECRPDIAVRAVAGGLHLRDARPERLARTAAALRAAGVTRLELLHCTGAEAGAALAAAMPGCTVRGPGAGTGSWTFE